MLSCKTDKSNTRLSWLFGNVKNVIFNGYDGKEKYPVSADLDAGEFNVTLKSLDESHAGLFICQEPGTNEQASALLTILGKWVILQLRFISVYIL